MNEPKRRQPKLLQSHTCDQKALAYAMRVWSGQSVDLPVKERLSRVICALEGQNLPTEGIDVSTIEAAQ